MATTSDEADPENLTEADEYEVLRDQDVDDEPPTYRPIGPGDVFDAIDLGHLAEPFSGPVMVVGHPCSLRRGLTLHADVPVAPIMEKGLPTGQHASTDRLLPVRKLLPPGSDKHHVVDLTLATTVAADRLNVTHRSACLSNAGIVALQQRLVGNLVRVKVPPGMITKHCRGPFTELELWTDWRADISGAGFGSDSRDAEFDEFMTQPSGFGGLSWRDAVAEHEHARGSAVTAMDKALAELLSSDTAE